MAKQFWENDSKADDGEFWKADPDAAKVDLPADVIPSTAGGGRGSVIPAPPKRVSITDVVGDPSLAGVDAPVPVAEPRAKSLLERTVEAQPLDLAPRRANPIMAARSSTLTDGRQLVAGRETAKRTAPRALADAALGVYQGAAGMVKGVADNVNAGDNPVSGFLEGAVRGAESLKSDDLREQASVRAGRIESAKAAGGELGAARAAFQTLFDLPAAALDVGAQGAGSLVPTLLMGAAGAGPKIMGAVNAASTAGDSASQVAEKLRKLPGTVWSDNPAYSALTGKGMSHEAAVAVLAPIFAVPAQLAGAAAGMVSGSTGAEKVIAGRAVGNTVGDRIKRVMAEHAGEQLETLAPGVAGNAVLGGVDGKTGLTEGMGQGIVDTAAGTVGPGALAARRVAGAAPIAAAAPVAPVAPPPAPVAPPAAPVAPPDPAVAPAAPIVAPEPPKGALARAAERSGATAQPVDPDRPTALRDPFAAPKTAAEILESQKAVAEIEAEEDAQAEFEAAILADQIAATAPKEPANESPKPKARATPSVPAAGSPVASLAEEAPADAAATPADGAGASTRDDAAPSERAQARAATPTGDRGVERPATDDAVDAVRSGPVGGLPAAGRADDDREAGQGRRSDAAGLGAPAAPVNAATSRPADRAERAPDAAPRATFKSVDEAAEHISKQRARGTSIAALPVTTDDGEITIAVKGTPEYDRALTQRDERIQAKARADAGIQEGDVLTKAGAPFKNKLAASNALKAAGPGHSIVSVKDGLVVRKGAPDASAPDPVPADQPAPGGRGTADAAAGVGVRPRADAQPAVAAAPEGSDGDGKPGAPVAPADARDGALKAPARESDSWVLREKATGKVIAETYDRKKVDALNTAKYEAVPALQHLQELNDPESLAGRAMRAPPQPMEAIAAAAHEAATSPTNDLPEPTQAQKDAGNYKLGHLSGPEVQGLRISVENPKGSERRGVSPDGTAWANTMGAHYGYVKGSEAADGDHVDVFVGPAAERAPRVWVIDQINPDGSYDEAKALFGFMNKAAAVKAYKASYSKGWKVGPVTEMSVDEFKAGLAEGRFLKPLDASLSAAPAPAPAAAAPASPKAKRESKTKAAERESEAARAAYFAPGNVVEGYGGFDRVLAYTPGPDWSVQVQEVKKVGDEWVPVGKPQDTRTHHTQPEARNLKKGPVFAAPAAAAPAPAQDAAEQRRAHAEAEKKRRAAGDRARLRAWEDNPGRAFIAKHGIALDLAAEWAPGPTERRQAMVQGFGPIFRKSGMQLDTLAEAAVEEGFLQTADEVAMHAMIDKAIRKERVVPVYAESVAEDEMEGIFARQREMEQEAYEAVNRPEVDDDFLAQLEDDAFPWDSAESASTVSDADMLRALGVPEDEIAAEIEQAARNAQRRGAGDPGPDQAEAIDAQASDPASAGREESEPAAGQPGLAAPSRADVVAQQERAAAGEKDAAARRRAEQGRLAADAQRAEFTLTGSDRAADADPNQNVMFSVASDRKAAAAERDKEYMAAVERGDTETAQRMVDEAARAAGYITGNDYRMQHTAPSSDSGNSLVTLRTDGLVPDDYWTHPHWYTSSNGERESHSETMALFRRMDAREKKGSDPGRVFTTVFRAVPKSVKDSEIRNGDWVTLSREYARQEGAEIPGGSRIISQQVMAKNLWWDGNSIAEMGFDDGKNYAHKNTKNNRKLVDAVTRDDDGNVVPLSKRFDSKSEDVRLRAAEPAAGAAPRLPTKLSSVENVAKAERLLGRLNKRQGRVNFRAVELTDKADPELAKTLGAVRTAAKRLFGHDVVFVQFDGPAVFNGAISASIPDTVFVRIDSAKPHMAILGHELLHAMRIKEPALYRALDSRMQELLNDKQTEFYDDLQRSYDAMGREMPDDWQEELFADIVGDNFTNPEFWREMAAAQPGLFRRVADAIVRFLDRVIQQLNPFGTPEFLTDAREARRVVVQSMRAFSQGARPGTGLANAAGESLSVQGQATLKDLVSRLESQHPGLKLDVSDSRGVISLSRIIAPERSKGTGTAVMKALAAYADTNGKRMVLTPSADFGGSKARLVDFYKRFGFVENKGRNKDYEVSESMYREPKGERLSVSGQQFGDTITAKDFTGRDLTAFSAAVSAHIDAALKAGAKVTYVAEGKPHEIVAVTRNMPQDATGQRWGMLLLTTAINNETRIEIVRAPGAAPAPAAAPPAAAPAAPAATPPAAAPTPAAAPSGPAPARANLTKAIFEGSMAYMRDVHGKIVKHADQVAKHAAIDVAERGQMLLRLGHVTEAQLKRWKASKLDIHDAAVNKRFRIHFETPGVVWKDEELRRIFKLDDAGIAAYRDLRATADTSIARHAVADMLRLAGQDGLAVRDQVLSEPLDVAAITLRDHLLAAGTADPARDRVLTDTANEVIDILDEANDKITRGFVPDDMKGQARPNDWQQTVPIKGQSIIQVGPKGRIDLRGTMRAIAGGVIQSNLRAAGDRLIYEVQDGRIDLKRTVEAITAKGNQIREEFDPRLAETLYSGRVATRTQVFHHREAQPLLELMARNRVSQIELGDYLHARAAPERNAQIAKVNPDMPDGGAGANSQGLLLTTAAAQKYIADLPAERRATLENMAKRVDDITRQTRALLVSEGLEKADKIAAWEAAYSTYVPMFREDVEFSRLVSSKRATGSEKAAVNILANVLLQREAAITRAEKNRINVAMYGLALTNPNLDFWATIRPESQVEEIRETLIRMGIDPVDAEAGQQGIPTIRTVDPATNEVVERPNSFYRGLPGAITLKVAGEDRVLMLNVNDPRAERLAKAMKGDDSLTIIDLAGSIVGRATRWLAAVNTQYNPVFGLVNFVRDATGGIIHLGNTQLRGDYARVVAGIPGAMRGIGAHLAGAKDKGRWHVLFEQFQADGAQTGFREMFADGSARAARLEKDLAVMQRSKADPRRVVNGLLGMLSGFNEVTENAVRLAAYATALDKGISRPEAARLARELTVDFNRKGRATRELGPLYAFFNAAIQGNERTLRALRGPTGAAIITGGITLGIMQSLLLAAAGYDDDDVPDFAKARGIIIPMFGPEKTYVVIPLPLGLHVLPNTGRILTDMVIGDHKKLGKQAVEGISEVLAAFNPLGGGNILTMDGALRTVAPTVIDPAIEVGFNKNFVGNSIEKDLRGANDTRPGFQRARESTVRSTTGQAYLGISKALNKMTGGSDFEQGSISPTPERVRYIAQTALGGVLRETEKLIDVSTAKDHGKKTPNSKIPVLGRFYGEVENDRVQQSRYFENIGELEKTEGQLKSAQKGKDGNAMRRIRDQNPNYVFIQAANQIQTDISDLNKLAIQDAVTPDQRRRVDEARIAKMQRLNEAIEKMERSRRTPTVAEKLNDYVRR